MEESWTVETSDDDAELISAVEKIAKDKLSKQILQEQDRKSRELNLVIVGIPFHTSEDPSKAVFDHVFSKLQVAPKANFRAFRLGLGKHGQPAPMMVQFQDESPVTALESRMVVMSNRPKMKGTPIRIFPDLSPTQRKSSLPSEIAKVQQAREQGLWCRLMEGVATYEAGSANRAAEITPLEEYKVALQCSKLNLDEDGKLLSCCESTDLEGEGDGDQGEEEIPTLPEHLVDTIVAMLPFPSIFVARGLSKSWLARFSPISSLADQADKDLSTSFQKAVRESSNRWKPFCPVSLGNENSSCQTDSFAYDCADKKWRRLPSMSYLPLALQLSWVRIDGALLYGPCPQGPIVEDQMWVTNILTRSWKTLPPHRNTPPYRIKWAKMVSHTMSDYKIIMVSGYESSRGGVNHYSVQIYDSASDVWISKNLISNAWKDEHIYIAVYLNGVLYIALNENLPLELQALDVEEGTLTEHWLSNVDHSLRIARSNLVICNATLLWIGLEVGAWPGDHPLHRVHVFKVDLGSESVLEVAQSPAALGNDKIEFLFEPAAFSVGDCIFLGLKKRGMLTYNLESGEWSSFTIPLIPSNCAKCWDNEWSTSFEPGSNPFMEV